MELIKIICDIIWRFDFGSRLFNHFLCGNRWYNCDIR